MARRPVGAARGVLTRAPVESTPAHVRLGPTDELAPFVAHFWNVSWDLRGRPPNAGVILYCRTLEFLGARIALDRARLAALDPDADIEEIERALALIPLVCAGDPHSGPIGGLPQSERFHWLVSPRSTVTQTSPVHSGLCNDDPEASLAHLLQKMVLR